MPDAKTTQITYKLQSSSTSMAASSNVMAARDCILGGNAGAKSGDEQLLPSACNCSVLIVVAVALLLLLVMWRCDVCVWLSWWKSLLLLLLRLVVDADVDVVVVVVFDDDDEAEVISLMPKTISELLLDDFVDDCTLCSEERFETLCVEVRNDIIDTKPNLENKIKI